MESPQELRRGSNAADNRGGRVHSLYTAPILQRSPPANLENMHSRTSGFSAVRYTQDQNKTVNGLDQNMPKDQNKEGAGYRLLNMLRITLKGSEIKEPEITPEVPTLVPFGDVKGCFIEEFEMLHKNLPICKVAVEFMFSYGNFGYGFSHQLKPLQKINKPSMFMNIAPPPGRIDPVTNVITPQPIEYPAFLSPDLNVTVGAPAVVPNQSSVVRLEKLQQQPRERLEKMKKEYRNLNTWIEKANYLEGILNPKMAHQELKETDTEKLLKSLREAESEVFEASDFPFVMEEAETVPSELLDNDDKKSLTLPTLNQSNQDNSRAVASESDESTKQTDESTKQTDESTKQTDGSTKQNEPTKQTPWPVIPILTITDQNQTSPLEEYQSKAAPEGGKNMFLTPDVKWKDRYPKLLKTDSSSSEVKLKTSYIYPGKIKWRNLESSPTELRWQSNNLSLARKKSTSLVSPDSKSKGRSQTQDPEEDLVLKV